MSVDKSPDLVGIVLERHAHHTWIRVSGEHDISSAPDIEREVHTLLAAGTNVVVDLSALTFADSSVLRVLVQESEAAVDHGCRFVLLIPEVPASAAVRRVIQLTQLERALRIVSSPELADAYIRSEA